MFYLELTINNLHTQDPISGRRLSDNIWADPSLEQKDEGHDGDDDASVIR